MSLGSLRSGYTLRDLQDSETRQAPSVVMAWTGGGWVTRDENTEQSGYKGRDGPLGEGMSCLGRKGGHFDQLIIAGQEIRPRRYSKIRLAR